MASAERIFNDLEATISLLDQLFRNSLDVLSQDVKDAIAAGTPQSRIDAMIKRAFDDLASDFSEAYDNIAADLVSDMVNRGVASGPASDMAVDALDDLRSGNAERIRQTGDVMRQAVKSWQDRAQFPGLATVESLEADIAAIADPLLVDMARDGQVFSRVAGDVASGAITEQGGALVKDDAAQDWTYEYQGPEDDRNRPHCALYVGKKLTRREIDEISSEQLYLAGDDPAAPLYKPYYSERSACRHNWVLVRQ